MVLADFLNAWNDDSPLMLVHTSGSTGKPKPLWVEKRRMEASARTTCRFLGLKPGDTALLCMPLDFIAGRMMVVRAIVAGLQLISVQPDGHPMRAVDESPDFAAMVPLQVYNSLQDDGERAKLQGIRHLIIGGGAIDEEMEKQLRDFPNNVWCTYGMTETLSHIALRRLNGDTADDYYTPFDSVNVSLDDDGCLLIDAPEVCAGQLSTNDRAEMAADGRRFRIIGRKDNVICSGGIKIQIEEVERMLKPHLPYPFLITKLKDAKFGEAVAMLIVSGSKDEAAAVCARVLPPYSRPRHYLLTDFLPETPTGKPARHEAERMAAMLCGKK
ncbi:MAG: AMP-binding protein [Prevotella sp.]